MSKMSLKGFERFFQSNPSSRRNIFVSKPFLGAPLLLKPIPALKPSCATHSRNGLFFIIGRLFLMCGLNSHPNELTTSWSGIRYYSLCNYHLFICRVIAVHPQSLVCCRLNTPLLYIFPHRSQFPHHTPAPPHWIPSKLSTSSSPSLILDAGLQWEHSQYPSRRIIPPAYTSRCFLFL